MDYIMTKKANIKITNCETDTRSYLRTDHYPVIADLKVKCRTNRQEKSKKKIVYNKKKEWTNPQHLNDMLDEINKYKELTEYSQWIKAYEKNNYSTRR